MIWKNNEGLWSIGKYKGCDWSEVDWSYEHKTGCPVCQQILFQDNSCDNLHVYGLDLDGNPLGGKCFACDTIVPSYDYVIETNGDEKVVSNSSFSVRVNSDGIKTNSSITVSKQEQKLKEKRLTQEQLDKILSETTDNPKKPVYKWLDAEVCKQYGVRWKYCEKTGKVIEMWFPAFIKEQGNLVITGYKVRVIRNSEGELVKDFYSKGYVGQLNLLAGQTDAINETVIVVEGENCLLSAKQMLKSVENRYNRHITVVSSLLGANSTEQVLKSQIDFINKHKKVVLALDNDEVGQKAQKDCLSFLPKEKVFTANLRHKDHNEYLEYDDQQYYAQDVYWNANAVVNFGLIGSVNLFQEALNTLEQELIPLPKFLSDLDDYFAGGIELGSIWNIISNSSTGKSVIVNEIVIDWIIHCPYKMLIVSLEDSAGNYGLKIASRIIGRKIGNIKDFDERKRVLKDHQKDVMDFLVDEEGESRFEFLDEVPDDLEEFKKALLYAIKIKDVKVVVLDPIASLISHKPLEEQIQFMLFQEKCRRDYDTTFLNICHTRKTGNGEKDASEGGDITEADIKGTSQIGATATINRIIRRNKMSDDPIVRNTTYIDISKNRSTGLTSKGAGKIFYHNESHTLMPYSYAEDNNFFQHSMPDIKVGFDSVVTPLSVSKQEYDQAVDEEDKIQDEGFTAEIDSYQDPELPF